MTKDNQFGDDAGTDARKPDAQQPKNLQGGGAGGDTGAGQEAMRGTAKDKQRRSPNQLPSEPLEDHGVDKSSGYGGNLGKPKTSSDQR